MTDKSAKTPAPASTDATTEAPKTDETRVVEQRLEREQAQGFVGTEVDPTPNEHYTLAGVTAGKPTPETDADAADAARKARG